MAAEQRPVSDFQRTLITGDTGFVGQHALALLSGAQGLSAIDGSVDLRDREALASRLRRFRPNAVIHLAALSFVPDSFKSPESTFAVNFMGTLNLLQALAETGFAGRMIYVGTGDAYGRVPVEELPIREERALRPLNPYAVSKAAAEALCFQWSQTAPFEVIMARPFNHIGAGQASTFAMSDFARQISEIAVGLRPPQLAVGNIDATRDFTDVEDVVRAYGLMLTHGKNGEIYNVCSGHERSVREMLCRLLELSGVVAEVMTDPGRYRPAEQARVCGSHEKLSSHTGWQPVVPLDNTLMNLYRYWENKIGN